MYSVYAFNVAIHGVPWQSKTNMKLRQELTSPNFVGRIVWAVAEISAEDIDRSNILQVSRCREMCLWEGAKMKFANALVTGNTLLLQF